MLTHFSYGEFNMGDKVTATPSPKSPSATSHHPNIMWLRPNFIFYSRSMEQLNNGRFKWQKKFVQLAMGKEK